MENSRKLRLAFYILYGNKSVIKKNPKRSAQPIYHSSITAVGNTALFSASFLYVVYCADIA